MVARGSWTLRLCVTLSLGGGLVLPVLVSPSPAWAAAGPTVVPITTFAVSSTQCDGPTYLPTLYQGNLLPEVEAELTALEGQPPGSGARSIPTVSSCSPLPAALAPVAGSASVSSTASPDGSATVTAQATGNAVVEESAQMNTTLSAAIPLGAPASSVVVSIPYATTGLAQTGGNTAYALVSFGQAPGAIMCVDRSYGSGHYRRANTTCRHRSEQHRARTASGSSARTARTWLRASWGSEPTSSRGPIRTTGRWRRRPPTSACTT